MQNSESLKKSIRGWIILFIICLVLSGGTAFALEAELAWLSRLFAGNDGSLATWIRKIYNALQKTNRDFPFLFYGYDWLAFAHLVIAISFIGPLKDPVKNKWVIQFGIIACILVFPLAFIAGHIRQIPFYWQLIDCSFGAVGIIPLYLCLKQIEKLEKLVMQKQPANVV